MKYRNKPCKICGKEDRSKRKVCEECKTQYPSIKSGEGEPPFNRARAFEEAKR